MRSRQLYRMTIAYKDHKRRCHNSDRPDTQNGWRNAGAEGVNRILSGSHNGNYRMMITQIIGFGTEWALLRNHLF